MLEKEEFGWCREKVGRGDCEGKNGAWLPLAGPESIQGGTIQIEWSTLYWKPHTYLPLIQSNFSSHNNLKNIYMVGIFSDQTKCIIYTSAHIINIQHHIKLQEK